LSSYIKTPKRPGDVDGGSVFPLSVPWLARFLERQFHMTESNSYAPMIGEFGPETKWASIIAKKLWRGLVELSQELDGMATKAPSDSQMDTIHEQVAYCCTMTGYLGYLGKDRWQKYRFSDLYPWHGIVVGSEGFESYLDVVMDYGNRLGDLVFRDVHLCPLSIDGVAYILNWKVATDECFSDLRDAFASLHRLDYLKRIGTSLEAEEKLIEQKIRDDEKRRSEGNIEFQFGSFGRETLETCDLAIELCEIMSGVGTESFQSGHIELSDRIIERFGEGLNRLQQVSRRLDYLLNTKRQIAHINKIKISGVKTGRKCYAASSLEMARELWAVINITGQSFPPDHLPIVGERASTALTRWQELPIDGDDYPLARLEKLQKLVQREFDSVMQQLDTEGPTGRLSNVPAFPFIAGNIVNGHRPWRSPSVSSDPYNSWDSYAYSDLCKVAVNSLRSMIAMGTDFVKCGAEKAQESVDPKATGLTKLDSAKGDESRPLQAGPVAIEVNDAPFQTLVDSAKGSKWCHPIGTPPPPEFSYGPLIGSKYELGAHYHSTPNVVTRETLRISLAEHAAEFTREVWIRAALRKKFEAFFPTQVAFLRASESVEKYRNEKVRKT